MSPTKQFRRSRNLHRTAMVIAAFLGSTSLTGCIVGGYSSGGGFFLWPGSLGLLVLILIVVFIARRR